MKDLFDSIKAKLKERVRFIGRDEEGKAFEFDVTLRVRGTLHKKRYEDDVTGVALTDDVYTAAEVIYDRVSLEKEAVEKILPKLEVVAGFKHYKEFNVGSFASIGFPMVIESADYMKVNAKLEGGE